MAVKKATTKKTTAAKKAATVETAVTAPVQTEEIVKAEEAVKVEEKAAKAVKEEKTEVKEAAPKKTAAKKAPAKKAVKTNLYVQAAGKEVSMEDAIARVKEAWKATGHKVGDLKEITVYVKPEEGSIYYVVNGEVTGRVEF
mgnify:CR=1 FL=1